MAHALKLLSQKQELEVKFATFGAWFKAWNGCAQKAAASQRLSCTMAHALKLL
eukprot:CAMPEP_0197666222 /NCGR_PEP_ID=MMETSP1338-20131121/61902_1 /TAXON_ID=43686 ORGANISM="Pelagodinium beii, Strain RCC1491" /NCGR_SAMPLE_ID=MMETSP1338 /ASSEMBLY_ACC=CAM_ASM_000754 /LENGTH=52 /DNA_ID=CAMNT_0043245223 /DNA_START=13 /DNA_END=167 /DNA_ORIENTATION=-